MTVGAREAAAVRPQRVESLLTPLIVCVLGSLMPFQGQSCEQVGTAEAGISPGGGIQGRG